MSKDCIEIGNIQAFLDSELSPRETAAVTAHTAVCPNCAQLLAEAEEENVLAFSALDRELDTLVPTQRLWTRISDSIELEKERVSIWNRLYSFISVNHVTPSFAAAAGVLLVFGLAFAVVTLQTGTEVSGTMVGTTAPTGSGSSVIPIVAPPVPDNNNNAPVSEPGTKPVQVGISNHSADDLRRMVQRANLPKKNTAHRPEYLKYEYLPGEESYIKTIGELERNTVAQNASLKAGGLVAYQRDLAVVEDSIKKMKDVVRKNPRNQAAKQVLYSAYQDKIDLLNSAAQRDELMASLEYRQ